MEFDALNISKVSQSNVNQQMDTVEMSQKTQRSPENKQSTEIKTVSDTKKNASGAVDNPRNIIDEKDITESMIKAAMNDANKKLVSTDRRLECSVHEKSKRVIVKIVDSSTKEIIREIPPEKALDAYAKMLELAGLLVDIAK